MSRPNMNQNMQNGIPPQWCGTQPQKPLGTHALNNGLGSSQSSRDSSPAGRIPTTQLPPARSQIPPSQLPPSLRQPQILDKNPNANTGQTSNQIFQQLTPHSSPRMPGFSTSTPITQSNSFDKRSDVSSFPNATVVSNNSKQVTNTSVNETSVFATNFSASQQANASTTPQMRSNNPQVLSNDPRFKYTPSINQHVLNHASSTPALLQSGNQAVRQNPIQPQNIPRPVSSGPQLQHPSPQLMGQSQPFTTTNPPQISPVINHTNRQQFPLQNVAPISTASVPQASPVISEPYPQQTDASYPSQNLKQQSQNVGMPPDTYATKPVVSVPKTTTYNTPISQYQNPQTSNIHHKRYPQQIPPVQQPNLYQPNFSNPITNQQNAYPPTTHHPSNFNPQQPTSFAQSPNIINQQSNTFNQQPIAFNQQSPTFNQQPTTFNQQSTNFGQQPTTFNQQPTKFNQQPTTLNQQQYKPSVATYPQQNYQRKNYQQNVTQQMSNLSVAQMGFNKGWGFENIDLLQYPNVLPPEPLEAPKVKLGQEYLDSANCSPDIFRCTMTKIPESNSLLQKSRLPLGVLIHPFKDLNHLPVIQCSTIVRCRACRTYINPFIFFVDSKRWKCNLCYRINELPEEFQYDPVSKSYGDPSRRPEIKSSTIEYIAPSEYMLRPPQPAVYLYLLDISRLAVETGYLHTVCDVLSSQLSSLPGDARTQIGFLAYNSTLHFFSLAEGLSQPHEMIVSDIDDVFLPCPDNLLVNLKEHMDLITDLLTQLPTRYQNSFDTGSVLGSALQAAFKLMSSTGGRVTVFQTCLPTLGPGALTVREDPNQRAGKEAPHLNPATDFYKRLALDCSAHQVAVDLFILNSQYVDIATLSGISRFSGGCIYHFPLFKASSAPQAERLERCFKRYLTRKIGFEAVMRIRCTRGLAIHTFHGNFFVRSTDLLSLPNVNPDAGFGMQVSIEESLTDLQTVCFQAALLYTSSKGERRIRVHTLCLPVASTLPDILNSADQQCIVGLLAKMAVDRSQQSSLSDARDAFINAAIDVFSSYKMSLNLGHSSSSLLAPGNLKLLPLYILALLKYAAFRTGQSTRLDDRVFAMCEMKSLPLTQLIEQLYPDLYPLHQLSDCSNIVDNDGDSIPRLPRLHLSARCIDSNGVYLLDAGQQIFIFVCQNTPASFLMHTLGVANYNSIPDLCHELAKIDSEDNLRLHTFINNLNEEKSYPASIQIIRENSPNRTLFLERLIEDRIESALSYNEFLQHLKTQVK